MHRRSRKSSPSASLIAVGVFLAFLVGLTVFNYWYAISVLEATPSSTSVSTPSPANRTFWKTIIGKLRHRQQGFAAANSSQSAAVESRRAVREEREVLAGSESTSEDAAPATMAPSEEVPRRHHHRHHQHVHLESTGAPSADGAPTDEPLTTAVPEEDEEDGQRQHRHHHHQHQPSPEPSEPSPRHHRHHHHAVTTAAPETWLDEPSSAPPPQRHHHHHEPTTAAPETQVDESLPTAAPPHHHHHHHDALPKGNAAAYLLPWEEPIDEEHHPEFLAVDPPDPALENVSFDESLRKYSDGLNVTLNVSARDFQETKTFQNIPDGRGHGTVLPHDRTLEATADWRACDPGNSSFSDDRDKQCGQYLANWNNMRSMKAQPSYLYNGRTIKFKVRYQHGGLTGIVKVSQKKFFFEAASEYLAYSVDRALQLSRVPTTVFLAIPVEYMQAASGIVSPFYAQWFDRFVVQYKMTKQRFVEAHHKECAFVTIQVWMNDVHSALMGFLAVNYDQNDAFFRKFYQPDVPTKWPPKEHRLTALGDLCDRFIFDFLIGNTDRGMNDHNNFVYGGCSSNTACKPHHDMAQQHRGAAKYAFLDHGSSFYSRHEPPGNPFTGNESTVYPICRFRKTTFVKLKGFVRSATDYKNDHRPFVHAVKKRLSVSRKVFDVVPLDVVRKLQDRLEKVVNLVEQCLGRFGDDRVFSL